MYDTSLVYRKRTVLTVQVNITQCVQQQRLALHARRMQTSPLVQM